MFLWKLYELHLSSFKQFSIELEFLDIETFYLLKLPRGENVSLAQAKAILEKKGSQTYAVEACILWTIAILAMSIRYL